MRLTRLLPFLRRVGLAAFLVSGVTMALRVAAPVAVTASPPAPGVPVAGGPLRVAYSDWPGWVPWSIAARKGWFEEAGVEVELVWDGYVACLDAYSEGRVDGVAITNGDALAVGGGGRPSVTILLNDFSNGNDMLVAAPGITSVLELSGKKIGAELGYVGHLFAITALLKSGVYVPDVEFVEAPVDRAAAMLAGGEVAAVAAWQPASGELLRVVEGSTAVFTSRDVPGLIYDVLAVSPESLAARRADWLKVIGVWYRTVDYLEDPANREEALAVLAERVGLTTEEYEALEAGTRILPLGEAMRRWEVGPGLDSIWGSTGLVNDFNVEQGLYPEPLEVGAYLDASLMEEFVRGSGG